MTRRSWPALVVLLLLLGAGVTHATHHVLDATDPSGLASSDVETSCDVDVPAAPLVLSGWVQVSILDVVAETAVVEHGPERIVLAPKTSPPPAA